jgi:hypothetical protein
MLIQPTTFPPVETDKVDFKILNLEENVLPLSAAVYPYVVPGTIKALSLSCQ